ncbi:TetR/AcrR family transcriptional regulator [Mycobacterium sp. 21AC1]|uniref:TetR/AcrR family transcriptional regulator n=1 Tax=[Mycobacterium] appelbergii TaxID=2939269 RepID=UPI002939411B|nr:TetR/AcrR family transcriptional regulator [Mycobacterium sp. 21AC1]MDV3124783.1 TetR/AcrR family transcriptional regulator [Mycobacterium sp. 21AC1]
MRRQRDDLKADCRAAVLAEVASTGLAGLTVEGIARRASAAKTSIYRHWATAEELLLDALSEAYPIETPAVEGGNLRGDLLQSLDQLAAWLRGPTAPVVAAILAERRRRPDLVEALYRTVFEPNGQRFTQTVIEHYAARGEIDATYLTPIVCDIGEALVIKHQIDTGEVPDQRIRAAIVDQAILPALGCPDYAGEI